MGRFAHAVSMMTALIVAVAACPEGIERRPDAAVDVGPEPPPDIAFIDTGVADARAPDSRADAAPVPPPKIDDPAGIAVSAARGKQSFPAAVYDGKNFFVVWDDSRRQPSAAAGDIYGARVDAAGKVLDPAGLLISSAHVQGQPSVAHDGRYAFIVWQAQRVKGGATGFDIYGARVDGNGKLVDKTPIAITAAKGDQLAPAVACTTGLCVVVWQDHSAGGFFGANLYAARVDTANGTVRDKPAITVSTAKHHQGSAAVASDGAGFLAVWRDYRNGAGGSAFSDVYGARINAAGSVLDTAGALIAGGAGEQSYPAIAFGGGAYLVAYTHSATASQAVYAVRVGAAAKVISAKPVVVVAGAIAREPAVAAGAAHFLVAWHEGTKRPNYSVLGARISHAGLLIDGKGTALSSAPNEQWTVALTAGAGRFLAVWWDWRREPGGDIFATRVTP